MIEGLRFHKKAVVQKARRADFIFLVVWLDLD